MTAYWDELRKRVRDASNHTNEEFVAAVIDIETAVIETVSLTTGDREFPEDLRTRVQTIIATNAIDFDSYVYRNAVIAPSNSLRNERALAWLLTMRYSILLEELHAAFHYVGERRVPTRFDAYFTDDPSTFLRAREARLQA